MRQLESILKPLLLLTRMFNLGKTGGAAKLMLNQVVINQEYFDNYVYITSVECNVYGLLQMLDVCGVEM